ncbi:uncharacterized protein LOC127283677 [Leptopilina boulardi]|uniref:uncharacterized protein LOC127283677 n=1 Tax=Leptopilina boulardi TaxID=63433 RepID=UPI0021F5BF68|nr:uncharacterized protein LOC127283677 [Leptopilina boulardi]
MIYIKYFVIFSIIISGVLAMSSWDINIERDRKNAAGTMLVDIAKELVQRSASTSQVLNLNLSSLLLLLVLKAVVYGAGYLGGHNNFNNFNARGLEDDMVSEGEVALAVGFLIGDTCLYRAACEVPQTAKEYLGAAEMILQAIKLMPQTSKLDEKYEKKMTDFRKAIEYGTAGHCPSEYNCKKENIDRFLRPE